MRKHPQTSSTAWFSANHGRTVHPLTVVAILSRDRGRPDGLYEFLERRRHLIPASYHDGAIDGVKLFFPKLKRPSEIERMYNLPTGSLTKMLARVYVEDGVLPGALRLPQSAMADLLNSGYLAKAGPIKISLGRKSHAFLRARNII
ncbi:MAG: hypothetical protein KJ600_00120 [Nanoarchaeota archaeon]|nr:hypothetical protein [Nanoarchaeota archaeon]MBU1102951.1 hypothetical protein [Nanoarchaeota archaeon]